MIFTEGSGLSCSCDLCGTTEHGITIPCSNGASWNCDGYDEYERAFHAYSEVCIAMMANQHAAKELKDLLFESKGVYFDEE